MPTLFNGCGFGPPLPLTAASSWPWVDHPVSGLQCLTFALFRLALAPAPRLWRLTLPDTATRRTVLQKVRSRAFALPLLVNTGFQVLFHSPPGVLFTVPSQYYALSVTKEYLALRGGPRSSAVRTPPCTHGGLGSSGFARRYSRYRCFFLFLRLLRCFSSPGSPPHLMDWGTDT